MTHVLVTGATGFVGRHVVRALTSAGASVVAVVRSTVDAAHDTRLPSGTTIVTTTDLFTESAAWWQQQCAGVDVIVHAAWYAEPGRYLQAPQNIDCLIGSLNLARGAGLAGVRRFVGIGTCFEYDLAPGLLSLDTPLKPLTPYAAAKASLFTMLSQWLPLQSVEFAWCRLFYLHGEGEDERRLVPYLRKQLARGESAELSHGTQIRDFLDVVDAARKIATVALGTLQGPLNICSGVPVTVRELALSIAAEYGRPDLLNFGSRPDNLVDPPRVVGVPSL
jgi:dTDP-6-deoxy-L-talose 4-dehydrogenase (NAD+)